MPTTRDDDTTELEELEATVTDEILEETPARALVLLRAVGSSLRIRRALLARGYDAAAHREGWSLIQATIGFLDERSEPDEDAAVVEAMRELEAIDEPLLRIVRASLRARHPAQATRVLAGLHASTGAESVVVVATLLERLDALGESRDRGDQAAIATLARRGIDAAERDRLARLVKAAKSASPLAPIDPAAERTERERRNALVRLRGWYEEWSDITRAVIRRRDDLIRLGLATRRARSAGEAPAEDAPKDA
ncbi:hypothetical protein [Sandaracinus amylolyticus]|uniref:Uncharacterized protein n=1 Tax=Sandaracinus amylolyticus TaxID=927083 RepID=A0A0F6YML4_9BACT|nr:hypothetical protein [Sandaracinus amylolyticus]AKF10463.1 hypothetical protein DB32_007612 [Sandaracinus amylolyticus]